MGKKIKTGKARQDKFYKLAKESGYRARSAFKLLQLNRKYEFLQTSRVCVDLCAAPGGWLQVASEHMPISSVIIGVDLVPIRPVRNCMTFQEDITTQKCRQTLRKELKTWNADVFLHDGAPNIGKNWIQDAFGQAELTLHAFKLATEFLAKGGWFVTKVFRSKDYTSLMWVFNQLFKKVFATKPQASRLESAEIFVVCQGFLKPDKLDPKFTDAKYVFKDVKDLSKASLNVIHPTKDKKKALGYGDDVTSLHNKLKASEFILEDNYLQLLGDANQIVIDQDFIMTHAATTDEIKEYCADIKVLGKGELRNLVSWRKKLLKLMKDAEKSNDDEKDGEDKDGEDDEDDENEDNINEKIAELKEAEEKLARKKKRKVLKEKRKLRDKMNLHMIIKGDKFETGEDLELFSLKNIKSKSGLDKFEHIELNKDKTEESDDEIEASKVRYDKNDKSYLNMYDGDEDKDGEHSSSDDDLEGSESSEDDDGYLSDDDGNENMEFQEIEKTEENPLLVQIEDKDTITDRKMQLWYNKDSFKDMEEDDNEDFELAQMAKEYESKGGSVLKSKKMTLEKITKKNTSEKITNKKKSKVYNSSDDEEEEYNIEKVIEKKKSNIKDKDTAANDGKKEKSGITTTHKKVTFDESIDKETIDEEDDDKEIPEDSDSSDESDNEKTVKKKKLLEKKKAQKFYKLSPEELALGEEIMKSAKRKREIIELSYNRFTYADEDLPDWFMQDEKKRVFHDLPITEEQVDFYKERNKGIATRTIKKVAEAKARKKKKVAKRLEKARKKAENINESEDVSEKEKWASMKATYKRAGLLGNKKKDVTYVVSKRGVGKRVPRPAGVKGHFKVVDPRMKKDLRKKKIDMKKNKNKK